MQIESKDWNAGRLSRKQAAAFLGCSVSQLAHGNLPIPYTLIGKRARYDASDLNAYLAAQRREPRSSRPRALLAGPAP